jgi:hypothetical protein
MMVILREKVLIPLCFVLLFKCICYIHMEHAHVTIGYVILLTNEEYYKVIQI